MMRTPARAAVAEVGEVGGIWLERGGGRAPAGAVADSGGGSWNGGGTGTVAELEPRWQLERWWQLEHRLASRLEQRLEPWLEFGLAPRLGMGPGVATGMGPGMEYRLGRLVGTMVGHRLVGAECTASASADPLAGAPGARPWWLQRRSAGA